MLAEFYEAPNFLESVVERRGQRGSRSAHGNRILRPPLSLLLPGFRPERI
jgi:hypothetical protein